MALALVHGGCSKHCLPGAALSFSRVINTTFHFPTNTILGRTLYKLSLSMTMTRLRPSAFSYDCFLLGLPLVEISRVLVEIVCTGATVKVVAGRVLRIGSVALILVLLLLNSCKSSQYVFLVFYRSVLVGFTYQKNVAPPELAQ